MAKEKPKEPAEIAKAPLAPFRSSLQLYPEEIRDKMDSLINMGRGAAACLTAVKSLYRGPLKLPSLGTFESYVKYRRKQLAEMTDGELKIQQVMAKKLDLTHVDLNNKSAVMRAILEFMAWRIEEVKVIQAHHHSAQFERIITDDVRVMLDTITAQLKVEDKQVLAREKVKAVMGVLLRYMGTKIQTVYKEVHGTKGFDEFVRELQASMETLPYEEIENQALQAFNSEDEGVI